MEDLNRSGFFVFEALKFHLHYILATVDRRNVHTCVDQSTAGAGAGDSSFSKIPSMHAWGPECDLQHPHKIRVWWLEPLTLVLRPETGGSLEPVGLLTSEAA